MAAKSISLSSMRAAFACIATLALVYVSAPTAAADSGKALVVMSSANQLQLRDGKHYQTGYYLDELALPLAQDHRGWLHAGFRQSEGQCGDFRSGLQ
jgi:hypothetical protein